MESFLEIWNSGINIYFSVGIGTLFILELILIIIRIFVKMDISVKSVILSVGIFGTFLGIFLGLQDFDSNNIDNSIRALLNGMTTAFYSSLIGMGATIILTLISKFMPKKKEIIDSGNLTNEDVQKEILNELQKHSNQLYKLDNLEKLEENQRVQNKNLILEIQNQNQENRSFRDEFHNDFLEMNSNLKKTLDKISDGASKEIIKALEKVIQDFNNNLTEQFGDNFKQLNEAVIKLLEWQKNYKDSIIEMEQGLQTAISSISQSDKSLEIISARNEEVIKVYMNIQEIIETYKYQTDEVNRHLETYAELSDKAKYIFPTLENQFESIDKSLKTIGDDFRTDSDLTKNHIVKNSNEIRNDFTELKNSLNLELEKVSNTFIENSEASKMFIEQNSEIIKESFENLENNISKSNERMNLAVSDNFTELNSKVSGEFGKITDNFEILKNNISANNSEITENYKTLNSNVSDTFEKINETVSVQNEKLGENFTELNSKVSGEFGKITDNFEILKDNISANNSEITENYKTLNSNVSDTFEKINQTVSEQNEKLGENFTELNFRVSGEFEKISENISKDLQEFSENYQKSTNEIISSLEVNKDLMKSISHETKEIIDGKFPTMIKNLESSMLTLTDGFLKSYQINISEFTKLLDTLGKNR